ncbi:MAG: sugar transferase [Limisphaerales bacterium]
MKRLLDVILAFIALVLAMPLLILVSVAIVVDSGWPFIFCQRRVGMGRREFKIYKFRSMFVSTGSECGSFDAGNCQRVTRIGRFLRKLKIDELPQLWNVIIGDMSMVGPRPEVPKWVAVYPEQWQRVLKVRPGITDPASILFRNEEEVLRQSADPERAYMEMILPQKLRLYQEYIAKRSTIGDLHILWRTILTVLLRQ